LHCGILQTNTLPFRAYDTTRFSTAKARTSPNTLCATCVALLEAGLLPPDNDSKRGFRATIFEWIASDWRCGDFSSTGAHSSARAVPRGTSSEVRFDRVARAMRNYVAIGSTAEPSKLGRPS
jgi:hypothetical protein